MTSCDFEKCECANPKIFSENGYIKCKNCGLILHQDLETKKKNEQIGDIENKNVQTATENIYLKSTVIGGTSGLDQKTKSIFNRLKQLDKNLYGTKEKGKLRFLTIFNSFKTHFEYPIPYYVLLTVYNMYMNALKNNIFRGRNVIDLTYSMFYVAFVNIFQYPYTIIDFKPNNTDEKEFKENMKTSLGVLSKFKEDIKISVKEINLMPYIVRKSYDLQYSTSRISYAGEIYLAITSKTNIRLSYGLIGAILYIAGKTDINEELQIRKQKTISSILGINEVTLRDTLKKIYDFYKRISINSKEFNCKIFRYQFFKN